MKTITSTMKTMITFVALLFISTIAVAQKEVKEPVIDTITTEFRVVQITGDVARIMTLHAGRFFDVPVTPELNPFNYVLESEREFKICIEVDRNLIYDKQTRGQTGVVPARIIWFTVSQNQLHRDGVQLERFINEPVGYDASPRYH